MILELLWLVSREILKKYCHQKLLLMKKLIAKKNFVGYMVPLMFF